MALKQKSVIRRPRKPKPPLYIGPWIRRLGVTQAEIARAAGIGESHMTLICKNERYPGPGVLHAIAQAMELSEQELRQPPPPVETVRATAGISAETLARLGQNLPKNDK